MNRSRSQTHQGFTLIELLVVISIIALLIAILLPALKTARDVGRSAQCLSNERQMGIAAMNYANDYQERLPPNRVDAPAFPPNLGNPWFMRLTPYMTGQNAYPIEMTTSAQWLAAADYNKIWVDLYCPAADVDTIPARDGGIKNVYGYNEAWFSGNYGRGYGLSKHYTDADGPKGESRRVSDVTRSTECLMVMDTRDFHTTLEDLYDYAQTFLPPLESRLPPRHLGGYNILFVDGHGETLPESEFAERSDTTTRPNDNIWLAFSN